MVKKLLIGLGSIILILIVFLPEISRAVAGHAFKNSDKDWAPGVVQNAAMINMRFWRYTSGGAMYKRAIEVWPAVPWVSDAYYNLALCYEKAGRGAEAIAAYDTFLAKYPQHRWTTQAHKRKANIQAVQ